MYCSDRQRRPKKCEKNPQIFWMLVTNVNYNWKICSNFVAFSEYMSFNSHDTILHNYLVKTLVYEKTRTLLLQKRFHPISQNGTYVKPTFAFRCYDHPALPAAASGRTKENSQH